MTAIKNIFVLIIFSMPLLAFAETTANISEEQVRDMKISDKLEARIRKIEDFQEITNLQAQYSYLIDTYQMEDLVDLFADDFVWEGGFDRKISISSKPDLLNLLKKTTEATSMMRHLATTPYIEIKGDHAKGTWYVFGMMTATTPDGEVAKWIQGKLNNEYVRVNDQWKISRKSTEYNFSTPYDDSWVKTQLSGNTSVFGNGGDPK